MVVFLAAIGATAVVFGPGAALAAGAAVGSGFTKGAEAAAVAQPAVAPGCGTFTLGYGELNITASLEPVGCIVVGNNGVTFDCWKPLVHDVSSERSCGIRLRNLVQDSRIRQMDITPAAMNDSSSFSLPQIVFHNIWDERFRLEYVLMPTGDIAGHAVKF